MKKTGSQHANKIVKKRGGGFLRQPKTFIRASTLSGGGEVLSRRFLQQPFRDNAEE